MYFDNFTIREVLRPCTDEELLSCILNGYIDSLLILVMILDTFRNYLEHPIIINSSYRDMEHNLKVGGSVNSQHMLGQAIDFTCKSIPFDEFQQAFREFLNSSCLSSYLGQVIVYKSKKFIHIALRNSKHPKLNIYEQGVN